MILNIQVFSNLTVALHIPLNSSKYFICAIVPG